MNITTPSDQKVIVESKKKKIEMLAEHHDFAIELKRIAEYDRDSTIDKY